MISKIKKPISILLVFMMIAGVFAAVPTAASAAEITVTWTAADIKNAQNNTFTINEVTLEAGDVVHDVPFIFSGGTFTTTLGNFTKIEISADYAGDVSGTGWSNDGWQSATWTGDAASVSFSGNIWGGGMTCDGGNLTIKFTVVSAPTYTVTWKNGDTTLKTNTVDKDAIPVYDGNTPTWPEDENYTYTFSGWTDSSNTFYSKDSNLPAVTKDETYTATFASEDKAVKNVIALISDLPAAAEITAADKAQIEAARAAYNLLTGDQKALVTNLDKLTAAETALAAAENLFPQHSVTLGGDIGVNFFINAKTADFASDENAYVKFTWDNGTYNKEVKLKDLPRDNNGNYKATVDVVAAQMAHKIHAEVYLNGEKLDQTDDYSVQDYAEAVYNDPTAYDDKGKPRELQALAKALLNYGAQAQIVFDEYLVEKPAPDDTVKTVGQTDFSGITAEQIKAAVNDEASDLKEVAEQLDAEFYTSSLIYLSRNTLRLYFTPASKTVGALDGKGFSGNLSEYYYFKDVENIPAAELDDQQTFTVGGTTFTFSALDYAAAVVNSDNMRPEQQNLAKALYLYNKAANEYFDAAPAPVENVVDLSTLTGNYEAQNNDVLTGTLAGQYKITIADGATVTLKDATITCLSSSTTYDGIALLGDATILLEGENTVKGGYKYNAGIFVPENKTLTIDGTGSLNVSSGGAASAIGAKRSNQNNGIPGGNIVINGGTINATGGNGGAGIGGCTYANCGTITITGGNITAVGNDNAPGIGSGNISSFCASITINGGTVTATGNKYAAGIGSGHTGSCGNITIAATVTQVTATKGYSAPNSIGAGKAGSCGTVTIEDNNKVTQN